MIWGCHSFEGGRLHAIFSSHGSGSVIEARLTVIWKALTNKGIIGYIYSQNVAKSKSIEKEFDNFSDYGMVHGNINHDTHIYMLELASIRKIAREGETTQEVVRRLIDEHKMIANEQKDYTKIQKLNEAYMESCKEGEKLLSAICGEIDRLNGVEQNVENLEQENGE